MEWRHYEARSGGDVPVVDELGCTLSATYTTGLVSTGRSRVFAGYFVKLILPSETEFAGEDEHSLRSALLHRFFDPVRADIEITDRFGKAVRPREWFFATPDHITEVVRRIQDGSITRCYFDPKLGIVDTAA